MSGVARAAWIAGLALSLAGVAAGDLWLRARAAFHEGERHMLWHRVPELKRAHLADRFEAAKSRVEAAAAEGRSTRAVGRARAEALRQVMDEEAAESSLKLAFHWFKTARDLFSTPGNRWARRSRERMVEAKALWASELDARGIPRSDFLME